jgi:uncharacterized protein DUF2330
MKKVVGVVAALLVLQVATPLTAQACACGGFVGDQKVQVRQETAIVDIEPGRETVTMQFAADTTATRAAWVMPVPGKADLTLGDATEFGYLDDFTKPEYHDVVDDSRAQVGRGNAAAAAPGGSAVSITQQVDIGPYSTVQLTGSDSSAVAQWLTQNGFTLPPALATGLNPYLAEGWSLTAVRLNATQGTLRGLLPPLEIAFDTSTPVYPMRLSGLATTPQALRLYVLAGHRMDASSPVAGRNLQLFFAGRDDTRDLYVSRYDGQWNDPSVIKQDIELSQSATDDPHREVITVYVQSGSQMFDGFVDWWLWAAGVAVLLAVIAAVLITVIQRRRRQR